MHYLIEASKGGNAARAANAANNARQNAATSSAAAAISKRSGMSLEVFFFYTYKKEYMSFSLV